MSPKVPLIVFELAVLATVLPAFGEDKSKQPAQVSTTELASFPSAGTIRIDNSYGDVNVEGWDQPGVQITVIKSMPFEYKLKRPDEAARHLDGVRVASENKSGNEIVISTTRRHRHDVRVEYQIYAPRDTKLVIHHGTGGVFVNGMRADIEATCGRGDIVLMLPDPGAYSIDARSRFGTVISDFEGPTHMNLYRLGQRYATPHSPAAHKIHLRVCFGGITIKAAPSEAYAPRGIK